MLGVFGDFRIVQQIEDKNNSVADWYAQNFLNNPTSSNVLNLMSVLQSLNALETKVNALQYVAETPTTPTQQATTAVISFNKRDVITTDTPIGPLDDITLPINVPAGQSLLNSNNSPTPNTPNTCLLYTSPSPRD